MLWPVQLAPPVLVGVPTVQQVSTDAVRIAWTAATSGGSAVYVALCRCSSNSVSAFFSFAVLLS